MNTPFYTLAIDILIRQPREKDDFWIRTVKLVPFMPANGVTLKLWCDETEEELALVLENVHYSFKDSMFIEEQGNDALVNAYRDGGTETREEILELFNRFGFVRTTFPQMQAKVG